MSSKLRLSNESTLLAAIQRKTPVTTPVAPEPPALGDPPSSKIKSRIGKPVQFWLHEEDRRMVRELAAWLAGQGIRSTDSMVIRAALRTAKAGGELLAACKEAAQLDGRLKQHKNKH